MVKMKLAAAVLAAAVVFTEGCSENTWLPGFGSERQEYVQSGEIFGNPLMGYAPSAWKETVSGDVQLLYVDVTWRELEPELGVYDWDAIEKENQFDRWKSEGKHLVLRFVCDIPGEESHMDIPDWLYEESGEAGDWYDMEYGKGFAPDYANETIIRRHAEAVKAMGKHWGADTLISYIELGSLGHWGEWHVNYGAGIRRLPSEPVRERYVQVWPQAFPKARILMRRPFRTAKNHGFGVYNDMAGHPEDTQTWLEWIENGGAYDQTGESDAVTAMRNFWKTAPCGGELTSSLSMRFMLDTNLRRTADLIRNSHTTFLGPKTADLDYPAGYRELLKNMGYRIWISSARLKQSFGKTQISLTWENSGTAPWYWDWPVFITVMDETGAIVEEKKMDCRLTELIPGEQINATVTLKSRGLMKRETSGLSIGVEIRDPMTGRAAVRLANQKAEQGEDSRKLILFEP